MRKNWQIRTRRAKKVRREPMTAPRTAPRGSLACEDVISIVLSGVGVVEEKFADAVADLMRR